jgi:hypothetical protein
MFTPGKGELRRIRGDREVAHRDELASRGGGDSVHPRDHRLRETRQGHHHSAAVVEEAALPRVVSEVRSHLLQIVPG